MRSRETFSRRKVLQIAAGSAAGGALIGAAAGYGLATQRHMGQLRELEAQFADLNERIDKLSVATKPTAAPVPTALPTAVQAVPRPTDIVPPTQVLSPTARAEAAPKPTVLPTPPAKETPRTFSIELGPEVSVFPSGKFGISYVPDGHTSLLQGSDTQLNVYVTGGRRSYKLQGSTLEYLQPHKLDGNHNAEPVLSPDPKDAFGRDYRGFGSVLKLPGSKENELVGIFHAEDWPKGDGSKFRATIGVAYSEDEGVTWKAYGPIIKGRSEVPFGTAVTGAGQPCARVEGEGGYIYVWYTDWSGGPKDSRPDAIHVARSKIADKGYPESWEKYTASKKWVKAGRFGEGESDAVIVPPDPVSKTHYAALPSISYNQDLDRLVAVFETDSGFYYTSGTDGVHWEPAKVLLPFSIAQQSRKPGDTWYSYPTLISPEKKTDQVTSGNGYLLCSKAVEGSPHSMVAFPFEIKS